MKLLVGYSVWNKVDMISWLLEGVSQNFDPATTDVAFHFDDCTDDSIEAFDSMVPYWLLKRGGFKPEQVHKIVSAVEVREVGGHNKLLRLALEKGCDNMVIAQDDQRFNKPLADIIFHNARVLSTLCGVFTGRDAYDACYTNFTGSAWSESPVQHRLTHGMVVHKPYMNSGPIVYNANVLDKVGFLDEHYRAHYVWDDYGARAHKAGLINGVIGMDVIHAKFGRMKATTWVDSSADLARLHALHGPII